MVMVVPGLGKIASLHLQEDTRRHLDNFVNFFFMGSLRHPGLHLSLEGYRWTRGHLPTPPLLSVTHSILHEKTQYVFKYTTDLIWDSLGTNDNVILTASVVSCISLSAIFTL